jgi:hypothetical protein
VKRWWLLSFVLSASLAGAQQKPISQIYKRDILDAQTIAVVADATSAAQDSQENQRARLEVETALRNWGKYQIVSEVGNPDLIMVVRKGHAAAGTIDNGTTTPPPVLIDPTGSGTNIGIHRGPSPPLSRPSSTVAVPGPLPGSEVGSDKDLLDVYLGSTPLPGDVRNPTQHPLDEPPAWSYAAKDALKSPKLEAVAQFRKAVEAAEKKKP